MDSKQLIDKIEKTWSKKFDNAPYSLTMLAQLLGVKLSKIRQWKEGQRPNAEDLARIALRLGITPGWLLLGEETPEQLERYRNWLNNSLRGKSFSAPPAWAEQYKVIFEHWKREAVQSKQAVSKLAFERTLGISHGKAVSWEKGQRPKTDDLEMLARKFNLSPEWLLLGIGAPFTGLESEAVQTQPIEADGRLLGDMLHDIISYRLRMEPTSFAESIGVTLEELEGFLSSRTAPSWDTLARMLTVHGINPGFLLCGQGPDVWPTSAIDRIKLAIGAKTNAELARDLDVWAGDIEEWPKNRVIPREWHNKLLKKYGLSPSWINSGKFPTNAEIPPAPPVVKGRILPVTGLATCGVQGWECKNELALTVDTTQDLSAKAFAVIPTGNSMEPEGIREGYICYVDPEREPVPNDAVYIERKDHTATIKLYRGSSPDRPNFTRVSGWLEDNGRRFEIFIDEANDNIALLAPVVIVKRKR
ncbi:helix-turn-helix domain-containing protein [Halodesulfovibrio aestuarii]|uniref:Helix-turn-helix domain-containing protein n=1 Tax=Halodesulfovibrio aestuarii TaxID=126333 RepID=A0ABV4JTW5_9BACT